MIDTNNINSVFDAKVIDPDGQKVGTVKQVYVDNTDGHPLFASVSTGLFGTSESFVPLEGADLTGDELRVAYDKDRIKDAPRIDADGDLSDDEQDRIFDHYGLGSSSSSTTTGTDTSAGFGTESTTGTTGTDPDLTTGTASGSGTTGDVTDVDRSAGHDTSGANTDDAMTRSEERLDVGTQKVQTGRARLRKHVVTEQQSVTVPVQHEEVRLETEPITDGNVGAATDGPALSDEEHEVTLSEERVVVDKETVPVERVRLGTETVTEQQQVSEDVSHEEIELDEDGTTRR
ncbi:photosystem reaction center subunit H [Curtobacterium sp. MCJR17_055]|uniref:DUF2382 domain-containing protein n=2 Tax=Curtobacterium TaxID=2034 RepID=UPI000D877649|nr:MULTISPECIES: PRC and DUF2382 domain-containing protein [unclassified Curtobacterium]PYY33480.1 photosystem reaction center subunit H [Curtobacterium sp. MCBD17_029]PYY53316.1 photosystem reaction center subunit H [Curtobacterium sp. MCJR17_055]PYY57243.1 photosystem reaction center subunit H [Curtobacterium sp. MCPF17_015]PZE91103.1 photosystem reaction center subunit H [Curtobacterium sp. MCBD17_008]